MRVFRVSTAMVVLMTMLATWNQAAATTPPAHSSHDRIAKSSNRGTSARESVPTGRLPKDVQPLAYILNFTMNPDKPGYSAHEEIRIRLSKPRQTIWLHGQGIDVSSAKLRLANGKSVNANYKQVNDAGVGKLTLPKMISSQTVRIVLNFNDKYSPGLLGAYKVKENGESYIFTQFEPIAARRAFPSFDEPAFKTPFTYSFTVPESDKVVANTPLKNKTTLGSGMIKWQFMKTKPLPTYLVAWAIGPLDIVKTKPIPPNSIRKRALPLYGVTVKGKGHQIHYALQHAGQIIAAEEKYFGIAFPWRKLALIAVPDFGAGAMENVGAITFRERLLLMNPKTAPTSQKRAYWVDAAHELAHQWTGDLVTVPWWNDIWLNEAFATWTEQKIMDELHPEWHPELDALGSRQYAMRSDSLVSARAIRQPIKGTGDIRNAFDSITYQKGAAVISMFENDAGPARFRKGMHDYLVDHRYGSADIDDFLTAISKAAGKDIAPAFKTFLNQPGLPLVQAKLNAANGKVNVHLQQSRYLPLGSTGTAKGKQWRIPVCMRYSAGDKPVKQCYMLTDTSAEVPLKVKSKPAWFMPNAQGVGYYQWSLGKSGYSKLTKSFQQLSSVEQISLAGSIEAAFRAGKIHTGETMQSLARLAHSTHEPVAEEPMGLIGFAHDRLLNDKVRKNAEAYARKLYSGYDVAEDFKRGGAPENSNRREFEASVAGFLADTGQDSKVRKAANAAGRRILGLSKKGKQTGKPNFDAISSDFMPVALRVAVRETGKPAFDALNRIFRHSRTPLVRNASLNAMASATDPRLARRVLAMVLKPGRLRQNEIPSVVFKQIEQPETRAAAWQWVRTHYDQLTKVLPSDYVARLPSMGRSFCSDAKADQLKSFFKDRITGHPGSKRALTEALESVRLCAAERKTQTPSAEKFFSKP